jgi:hypothetical protein
MDGKRPRQADALLHAAAKLIGIVLFEAAESNEAYIVLDSFGKLLAGYASDLKPEGNVVHDGLPR